MHVVNKKRFLRFSESNKLLPIDFLTFRSLTMTFQDFQMMNQARKEVISKTHT